MSEAVRQSKHLGKRPLRPLERDTLTALAIAYVGRFATTRAKLLRYLERKLFERGWAGEGDADISAIAQSLVDLGYVDDATYADMKARSLGRRGYGAYRVSQALQLAGVSPADRKEAVRSSEEARLTSALRLAERRGWGPFAGAPVTDPAKRERIIAAFMRAGHDARLARRIVALAPGSDVSDLED